MPKKFTNRKPQVAAEVTVEAIDLELSRLQHAINVFHHIKERMAQNNFEALDIQGWRSFRTNSVPRVITASNNAYRSLLRAEADIGKDVLGEESSRKAEYASSEVKKKAKRTPAKRKNK